MASSTFQSATGPCYANGISSAIFGSGSDGALTVSTTVLLTQDTYYTNLTINGGNLITGGFRVFVQNVLSFIGSNGSINNDAAYDGGGAPTGGNGGNAAFNTAGAGGTQSAINFAVGTIGSTATSTRTGAAGRNGPGNGTNGTSIGSNAVGGAGGNGAFGNTRNGGTGGVATDPTLALGGANVASTLPYCLTWLTMGSAPAALNGGAGGGSGGMENATGGANNASGGGGAGAGLISVCARYITVAHGVTARISANGGTGGNGFYFSGLTNAYGGAGGGGGGGGVVVITQSDYAALGASLVVQAKGGAHGTSLGPGLTTEATNGADGVVYTLRIT